MTSAASLDVSVVIPAYGGAATIVDCLASVQRAAAGRSVEIVVVESSGDDTAAFVRDQFPEVRLIVSPTRLSAGAARNRGAAEARAPLIFFVDQDCIVPPDWIARLEEHLVDPAIGAAGGSVGIRNLSSLSGCAMYFLEFLYHFPAKAPARQGKNFLVGCNSGYRAEALRRLPFPDQTLGEDVLFSHALQANGFGVIYDPAVEVLHQNRHTWKEFFNYNRKMGRSAAEYHAVLRHWWIAPFFSAPLLAFLAPFIILPSIAVGLARARWSYLIRFLFVSPMCLAGNLVWANAFRQQVLRIRARDAAIKTG